MLFSNVFFRTPASTTQLPATDATIPQQQQPAIRTVSTCSSSFSSTSVCKDTEILKRVDQWTERMENVLKTVCVR